MSVYPTLRYQDPDKAIAYLRDALGFTVAAAHRDENGTVAHAELVQNGGAVLVGPQRDGDRFGTGRAVIYVAVDDVDGHHDRAVAAGATVIMGLTDQDYGSREYAAVDGEDNVWSFGTYRPDTSGAGQAP